MKHVILMTILLCAGFSPASVLGDIAASMQPGTWAEVPQTNIGAVLGGGAHTGNLIPYGFSAVWDPSARRLHYLGGDHGCSNSYSTHVYYDEAANAWTNLGPVALTGGCHGWDHLTIDPAGRRLYFSPYGTSVRLLSYDLKSNGPWTSLGNIPLTGYEGIIRSFDWFEGSLSGADAGGALLCYNSQAANGELLVYDPGISQWIADIKGFGGNSTYNEFCEYSRVHNVAVMGGGNNNPKKVWRLNADRTVTALTDAPINLGIHRGIVMADPVSGHFVAWGSGQVWELDPRGAGTWTRQTGSSVPPSAVYDPALTESTGKCVIGASISTHGVCAFISAYSSNCTVYLYKHAPAGNSGAAARPASPMAAPSVFPVPARVGEWVHISPADPAAQCAVYDVRGRLVARLDGRTAWHARGAEAGVYILKARTGGRTFSKKLILE